VRHKSNEQTNNPTSEEERSEEICGAKSRCKGSARRFPAKAPREGFPRRLRAKAPSEALGQKTSSMRPDLASSSSLLPRES